MVAVTILGLIGWLAAILFFALWATDSESLDRHIEQQVRIRMEGRGDDVERRLLAAITRNKRAIKDALK